MSDQNASTTDVTTASVAVGRHVTFDEADWSAFEKPAPSRRQPLRQLQALSQDLARLIERDPAEMSDRERASAAAIKLKLERVAQWVGEMYQV